MDALEKIRNIIALARAPSGKDDFWKTWEAIKKLPWRRADRHESDRGDSFGVEAPSSCGSGRSTVVPTLNIPKALCDYLAALSPVDLVPLLEEAEKLQQRVKDLEAHISGAWVARVDVGASKWHYACNFCAAPPVDSPNAEIHHTADCPTLTIAGEPLR